MPRSRLDGVAAEPDIIILRALLWNSRAYISEWHQREGMYGVNSELCQHNSLLLNITPVAETLQFAQPCISYDFLMMFKIFIMKRTLCKDTRIDLQSGITDLLLSS